MVATLEDKPESLLYPKNISLKDMITLELLLEIDELTSRLGEEWKPLGSSRTEPPINMFAAEPPTELQEVIKIWQDAFEWSYYDTVLSGIILSASPSTKVTAVKSFQTIFCIDQSQIYLF